MTDRPKLYISGPMTGIDDDNRPAFAAAARQLRAAGYEVVSPAELDDNERVPMTWHDYLRRDIKVLMDCDAVATLPGWRESRGAKVETNLAMSLDMPVHHVMHWLTVAVSPELEALTGRTS